MGWKEREEVEGGLGEKIDKGMGEKLANPERVTKYCVHECAEEFCMTHPLLINHIYFQTAAYLK